MIFPVPEDVLELDAIFVGAERDGSEVHLQILTLQADGRIAVTNILGAVQAEA